MPEKQEAVARVIAGLADLGRDELAARWESAFGRPAPFKLSRALIEKALAYEIQRKAFGGLSRSTRKALRHAVGAEQRSATTRRAKPGARLIREWNGRTYEVDVLDGGFEWEGQTYRSLSRIAREITGANWSGPRFFGLTGKS